MFFWKLLAFSMIQLMLGCPKMSFQLFLGPLLSLKPPWFWFVSLLWLLWRYLDSAPGLTYQGEARGISWWSIHSEYEPKSNSMLCSRSSWSFLGHDSFGGLIMNEVTDPLGQKIHIHHKICVHFWHVCTLWGLSINHWPRFSALKESFLKRKHTPWTCTYTKQEMVVRF